jgi:carboxyl-terminal processing protease
MNKLFIAALGGTLAGILMTSNFTGPLIAQETSRVKSTYEQLDLFGDIFERIRSAYVEEVDETELIHSAIDGMLSSLDPHSSYLEPQDFGQMQVQTRGEFGGLGIEVTQENGFVKLSLQLMIRLPLMLASRQVTLSPRSMAKARLASALMKASKRCAGQLDQRLS